MFKQTRKRIFLAALVFTLSVTPHACFVEQAIAALVELLPHGHSQDTRHEHDQPVSHQDQGHHGEDAHPGTTAPSHCHDEEGQEGEFCCDNQLYLYIAASNQTLLVIEKNSQSDVVIATFPLLEEFGNDSVLFTRFLDRTRHPLPARARDKYALSCLLHAPPAFQI